MVKAHTLQAVNKPLMDEAPPGTDGEAGITDKTGNNGTTQGNNCNKAFPLDSCI